MTSNLTIGWQNAPAQPEFELPDAAGNHMALLTWSPPTRPTDAGVPAALARCLAATMCSAYRVTFFSHAADGAGVAWEAKPRLWAQVQKRWLKRWPLVCTQDPAIAETAFDEGWDTRGQTIFLTSPHEAPPTILAPRLQGDDLAALQALGAGQVQALVLPGVDGDCAGLYTSTQATLSTLMNAISTECQRQGIRTLQGAKSQEP